MAASPSSGGGSGGSTLSGGAIAGIVIAAVVVAALAACIAVLVWRERRGKPVRLIHFVYIVPHPRVLIQTRWFATAYRALKLPTRWHASDGIFLPCLEGKLEL